MSSVLEICNMALVEVPAQTIASISERSQAAFECGRCYAQVLGEFVEEFKFDFATARTALAEVINPRDTEWSYAYALPANMAQPLKIVPSLSSSGGQFTLLAGQTIAPLGSLNGPDPLRVPYEIEDNILYCGVPDAILVFLRTDVDVTRFPRLFVRALVLEMAQRMVMPLIKSPDRQAALAKAAEVMKQRALAENLNRAPTVNAIPYGEVERARLGWEL